MKLAVIGGTQPVPEVVEMLEKRLEEARNGDVRAIAIAFVRPGGEVATEWVRGEKDNHRHELVAAVTYLQSRIAYLPE